MKVLRLWMSSVSITFQSRPNFSLQGGRDSLVQEMRVSLSLESASTQNLIKKFARWYFERNEAFRYLRRAIGSGLSAEYLAHFASLRRRCRIRARPTKNASLDTVASHAMGSSLLKEELWRRLAAFYLCSSARLALTRHLKSHVKYSTFKLNITKIKTKL